MTLPTDTVLDGPDRDPRIDDEAAAVLKAFYLTNAPEEVRSDGRVLTDTEIIDSVHELVQRGLFEIKADGETVRLVPTRDAWTAAGIEPPNKIRMQEKAKAKRRQRRKQFRR